MFAYSLPAVTKTLRIGQENVIKRWKAKTRTWDATPGHQEFLVKALESEAVADLEDSLGSDMSTKVDITNKEIKLLTILNIIVEWIEKGSPNTDGMYKAVVLKKGFHVFENGVASIRTKSGDIVYLKAGGIKTREIHNFMKRVQRLHNETGDAEAIDVDELIFPIAVVEDKQVDMDSLIGLGCCDIARVTKASQKINFSMDEVGAKAKVEVKMTMTKSIRKAPKQFIIDGPFTVWILKQGTLIPYFCANITKEFLTKN